MCHDPAVTRWARKAWSDHVSLWRIVGPKDRWGLALWGGITVVAALAMVFFLGLAVVDEVTLDLHHKRVEAIVVRTNWGRWNDTADVRFRPGVAAAIEAKVQLAPFSDDPSAGDRIAIEYDPSDPTRARRAGAHDILVPVVFFGLVAAASVFAIRRDQRRRHGRRRGVFGRRY